MAAVATLIRQMTNTSSALAPDPVAEDARRRPRRAAGRRTRWRSRRRRARWRCSGWSTPKKTMASALAMKAKMPLS